LQWRDLDRIADHRVESAVALATDQDSVTLPPPAKGEIDAGEAVNEEIVGTVALLPTNGTASVCRGTSRRVDGEVAVKLTLGAACRQMQHETVAAR
jgi:hypothetical protein